MNTAEKTHKHEATTNACKLCTPLGASLAFKGIRGAVPLMHGSQGCSTYIRRYLISHYKEPIDIASSNFSEDTAIFGGGVNLKKSITNIINQYQPELVGISTTCLSETIGDDVPMILHGYKSENTDATLPEIVHVSTPSYSGTHADGFIGALRALVDTLTVRRDRELSEEGLVNLIPGMVSPADLRYVKEILDGFDINYHLLPDYSETLDGGPWKEYHKIPEGGTCVEDIAEMGSAVASIEFGDISQFSDTAGKLLSNRFNIPVHHISMPMGVTNTDRFFDILSQVSGKPVPEKFVRERERLLDSYVDGHKYVFGAKAVVYGEEDLVAGMFSFLTEIGITPVLCASGGTSGKLKETLEKLKPSDYIEEIMVLEGADFVDIEDAALDIHADFFIGSSKGYSITRKLGIPLVRVGFPIHDRLGGPRMHHVGYRGTQELFDRVTNTLLEIKQDGSDVGYSYL